METKTNELGVITHSEAHEQAAASGASCPFCGSENTYGISRVVGYYSPINNWNLGKQEEFQARQTGDYKL